MDWFDLLAVQGTLKSPPAPQFESINSLQSPYDLTLPPSTMEHGDRREKNAGWDRPC